MTDWEDKRQKLLEEGADEDEIAYNRALYDDDDEHDYELDDMDIAEMKATIDQMWQEEEYGKDYNEDLDNIIADNMPIHFLWDTLGAGPYIKDATMEDIELTIGRIYMDHGPDPCDPYIEAEDAAAGNIYEESEEEQEYDRQITEAINKLFRSQEYFDFLKALWKKKQEEHLQKLKEGWEKAKKEREEFAAWEKEHPDEIPF